MRDFSPRQLHELADTFAGGTPDRTRSDYFGGGIPWIKSTEVNLGTIRATEETLTELGLRMSAAKWTPANAVLVALYGATAGQVAFLEIAATANQAVLSVVPSADINARFLYYALLQSKPRLLFLAQGSGQPNLSKQIVDRLRLDIPQPLVQQRIAEILTTVDEAIEQTEALIAKTQQIKSGLMHDLFTRGVTPNGQLRPPRHEAPQLYKNSPVGWIPKEWVIARLCELAEIRTGIAKNAGRVLAKPMTVQYLRVANVQDGFLDLSEMKTIQIESTDFDRYRVLPNDVLMNEGGDLDKLGRGAIWTYNEPCVHQNHVFVVRCGPRVRAAFLNAWTGSPTARRYFMVAGKQTTNLASINKTQLGRLSVLIPPPEEQTLIVQVMETPENQVLADMEKQSKLRLVKLGLMHDLLTGRVRVPIETKEDAAS